MDKTMFFLQISLILEISTCVWQTDETVKGSTSRTNELAVQYNSLMNIDTGYSNVHEDIKNAHVLYAFITQEEITENTVTDLRDKVYKNLLCSYVFICRHYMNLIKVLVDQASEFLLETVFEHDVYYSSGFQYQIVGMFLVLKHLGAVDRLEPLWQMYVYLECLKTISFGNVIGRLDIRQRHIEQSDLISCERDIVYRSLTRFTDNNCHPDNAYNHQYSKSDYFKQLEKLDFSAKNADDSVRNIFYHITESSTKRFWKTKKYLSIDDDRVYFLINDLRLQRVTLNDSVMVTMLKHFAEMEGWADAQELIYGSCSSSHLEFYSVRSLVLDVGQCLRIFYSLIKYIIARNAMKYVLDVQSTTFPINGNLTTTNETMLNYCEDIISFLKMDRDEELKFIVGMFNSAPQGTFSDPKTIKDNENRIENIMGKYSEVLCYLPSTKIASAHLDVSYKRKRRAKLLKLAKNNEIKVCDSDGNEYEGMLDLLVFKSYIGKLSVDTNFDIALSFFEFSENN